MQFLPPHKMDGSATGKSKLMPEASVSPFLDGRGSSGHTKMAPLKGQPGKVSYRLLINNPTPNQASSQSPANTDALRRAKWKRDLTGGLSDPANQAREFGRVSPSFNFDLLRYADVETPAESELWRPKLNFERPQTPPLTKLPGFAGKCHHSELSEEEKRTVIWERAEQNLNYSRKFGEFPI
jgi:hypothetical protein